MPSIGTVGDSFDNALAETVNGYYKAELIRRPAHGGQPWKTVEDVELATLGWVHWHNHQRLHGYLDDVPPAEFEQSFYATKRTDQTPVESYSPSGLSRVPRSRDSLDSHATVMMRLRSNSSGESHPSWL